MSRSAADRIWIVADQMLVSSCNFVTLIILARALGKADFGYFALFYSAVTYLTIWQNAFLIVPMMNRISQAGEALRAEYLRSSHGFQVLFGVAVVTVIVLGSPFFSGQWDVLRAGNVLSFGSAVLFLQMQEWVRRQHLAAGFPKRALINDLISYGLQVVILAAVAACTHMSLAIAFWVMAVTSATAYLVGIVPLIHSIGWPQMSMSLGHYRSHSDFGLPFLIATNIGWIVSQGLFFIGAWYYGVAEIGGIKSAMALIGPFNVIIAAMDTIVPLECARLLTQKDERALRSHLMRLMVSLTGFFVLIALPLLLIGPSFMARVYGAEYAGFEKLLPVCILLILAGLVTKPVQYYFRALEAGKVVLELYVVSLSVSMVALLGGLMAGWGSSLILVSMLSGYAASALYGWVRIYFYISPK